MKRSQLSKLPYMAALCLIFTLYGRPTDALEQLARPGSQGEPRSQRTLEADGAIAGTGVPDPACEGGVVKDDGSFETGYGWVPSVIEGEYVQVFDRSEFPSRRLQSVCICWLRTRPDDSSIDFEVVFYASANDEPAGEPFAVVPGHAPDVPLGVPEGQFYEVDVSGVELPDGVVYIGPRWDASADQFFFVCADTSPDTPFTNMFFRDDRSKGEWDNAAETNDPIFADHRAILVRPVAGPPTPIEIPTVGHLGGVTLAILLLTLSTFAIGRLR